MSVSSASLGPSEAGERAARPVRAPNRAAHEKLVEEISSKIAALEERRRFLLERHKELKEDLAKCRAGREAIIEERNGVENRLAAINKEVNTRSENVQKLRANIPYLSEERVNEQIKTLEDLMVKHHYKRSEENKIIQEVNRLKKSKKLLADHNKLKNELEGFRKQQRQIRERRDFLFRQRGEVKKSEDQLKRDANEIREELEQTKGEMDELYNLRRQSVNEFRLQDAEHKKYLFEKRSEQRIKRKEERDAAQAEKQKDLDEIKASAEPYQEELTLISNLLSYCLRFEFPSASSAEANVQSCNGFLSVPGLYSECPRRGSHESGLKSVSGLLTPNADGTSTYGTPMGVTPVSTPGVEFREGFAYRKEDFDDSLFPGVPKKSSRRNSRIERRNSKVKPLTHNPEIYSQFDRFDLKPPCLSSDVINVMNCLKQKQQYFETQALKSKASLFESPDKNCSSHPAKTATPSLQLNIVPFSSIVAPKVEVTDTEASEDLAEIFETAMNGDEDSEHIVQNTKDESFPNLPEKLNCNTQEGFFAEKLLYKKHQRLPSKDECGNEGENNEKIISLTDNLKKDLQLAESVIGIQDL